MLLKDWISEDTLAELARQLDLQTQALADLTALLPELAACDPATDTRTALALTRRLQALLETPLREPDLNSPTYLLRNFYRVALAMGADVRHQKGVQAATAQTARQAQEDRRNRDRAAQLEADKIRALLEAHPAVLPQ